AARLEAAGGVEALVLDVEAVASHGGAEAAGVEQRRLALAQRNRGIGGHELAVLPHGAVGGGTAAQDVGAEHLANGGEIVAHVPGAGAPRAHGVGAIGSGGVAAAAALQFGNVRQIRSPFAGLG